MVGFPARTNERLDFQLVIVVASTTTAPPQPSNFMPSNRNSRYMLSSMSLDIGSSRSIATYLGILLQVGHLRTAREDARLRKDCATSCCRDSCYLDHPLAGPTASTPDSTPDLWEIIRNGQPLWPGLRFFDYWLWLLGCPPPRVLSSGLSDWSLRSTHSVPAASFHLPFSVSSPLWENLPRAVLFCLSLGRGAARW